MNQNKIQRKLIRLSMVFLAISVLFSGGLAGRSTFETSHLISPEKVYSAENENSSLSQEEILVFTGDPEWNQQLYVYAPTIYAVNSDYVIFGNGEGIIIYDRKQQKVAGLIDVQRIRSAFYNGYQKATHVFLDNNKLVFYNTKNEKAFGSYHVFDLSSMDGDGSLLTPASSGKEKEIRKGYVQDGKAYEKDHYQNAWENVTYFQSEEYLKRESEDTASYSEKAFIWRNENNESMRSILLMDEKKNLELYSEFTDASDRSRLNDQTESNTETINLGITESLLREVRQLASLPAYKYTGNDPAVGTICESLIQSADKLFETNETSVCIPTPTIIKKVNKKNEVLIFGNFWMMTYCKRGNTLFAVSGGEQPACYHLKKSGDNYKIVNVDVAGDGDEYAKSIKRFTKGYPFLYKQFMNNQQMDDKIRKREIRAYADSNGLSIKFYKDFGWDPVKIS